jgi:hypothetical protein
MLDIGKGIYQDEERDELRLTLVNDEELYLHSGDLIGLYDRICKLIPESSTGKLISCK